MLLLQRSVAEMVQLRKYIKGLGGRLDGGWSATVQLRAKGKGAGLLDREFRAPDSALYRSRVELHHSLALLDNLPE